MRSDATDSVATSPAEETMAGTAHLDVAAVRTQHASWGRGDTVLLVLEVTTLVLVAAQFALAGLGAFTMIRSPAEHAYAAHMVLGMIIGILTWIVLGTALASRAARAQPRTLWPAAALAVLAIPVEPLLAEAGRRGPAGGAPGAGGGLPARAHRPAHLRPGRLAGRGERPPPVGRPAARGPGGELDERRGPGAAQPRLHCGRAGRRRRLRALADPDPARRPAGAVR